MREGEHGLQPEDEYELDGDDGDDPEGVGTGMTPEVEQTETAAFANMVRWRRKELGLTLGELAEGLGWDVPFLSAVERGVYTLLIEKDRHKLLDALGIARDTPLPFETSAGDLATMNEAQYRNAHRGMADYEPWNPEDEWRL